MLPHLPHFFVVVVFSLCLRRLTLSSRFFYCLPDFFGAGAVLLLLSVGLCSVDKRVSQILNGHTGTFAKIKIPGRAEEAQVSHSIQSDIKSVREGPIPNEPKKCLES